MFLACQARKVQNDYLQHCDSIYYKRLITISSKRVEKAIKKHQDHALIFLSSPTPRQFDILDTICSEYQQYGYQAEVRKMADSSEKYLYIGW